MTDIDIFKLTLAGEILPCLVGQFGDGIREINANADEYIECARNLADKLYNSYAGV